MDERPDSSSKDIGMMPAPAMTTLKTKNDNRILKQLLSQEDEEDNDDGDAMTATTVATTTATTTTASVSSDSTLEDTNVSLEKNEAEPKKMDNALLKVGRMRKEGGEVGRMESDWEYGKEVNRDIGRGSGSREVVRNGGQGRFMEEVIE